MAQQLEKGFLQIPVDVLTTTKINGKLFGFAEKAVYSYLLNWSKSKDKVFPSTRFMCEKLGIGSRNSLTKYLDKLVCHNLLTINKTKGKSSEYTVLGLDGATLDKPKRESLVRGTNQDVSRVDKVVKPVPKPEVTTQFNNFQEYDQEVSLDNWDEDMDGVPF